MNKNSKTGLTTLAALAALAAAGLTMPSPAQAWQSGRSDGPICLESNGITGIGRICDFYSIAQCKATAQGINGTCAPNPWYVYDNDAPRPVIRGRRY